ncbi:MAG: hypothetical protein SOZ00_00265 [Tidjanibacter sp.]|nr:hypothetical protein [Tidjanibacter sp.]
MKKIIILIASLTCFVAATAQEELSRRVDISRDYTVGVQSAEPLAVPISRNDTVVTRPVLSFNIRPTEWNSSFEARPVAPAALSSAEWTPSNNFYLKAAGGYPWRSALDLYYTPVSERRSTVGFYLNHDGIEGKVDNLQNKRVSALSLQNRLGGFYNHYGRLSTLTVAADNRFDFYTPYGGYLLDKTKTQPSAHDIFFNRTSASADLVGRFAEGNDLSYTVAAEAQHLLGASYDNRHSCTDYNLSFALSNFGNDSTSLFVPSKIALTHGACISPSEGYHNVTVSVMPEWNMRLGGFPLSIAVGYLFNTNLEKAHNNFIFDLDWRYDRLALLTPFVSASRSLVDNSFDRLVAENPYLKFGSSLNNQMLSSLRVGIEGSDRAFSYRLTGGAERFDGYTSFCLIEGPKGLFEPISTPLTLWYAAAEVNIRTTEAFAVNLSGRWNAPHYDTSDAYRNATAIPSFKALANFRWTLFRRLVVGAGVEVLGKADHLIHYSDDAPIWIGPFEVKTLPVTWNLKASAEYSINNRIAAFVEADNLLNQTIYRFYSYPSLGRGIVGGVKMTF